MSEETKTINFNQDEYKKAVTAFNAYLKEKGKDEIVWEGLDEGQQITNFLAPIIEAMDTGTAGELPPEVIDYYNNHFAEEDEEEETPEEKPSKGKKGKSKKSEKKPKKESDPNATKPWQKPVGKEKLVYELVKEGKTDKEIRDIILEMYEGHPDPDFVEWRIYTYMIKGKNFLAKDDPEFAAKWAEERKNIKPVPHPSKKKTPEEIEAAKKKKEEAKKKKEEAKKKKEEEKKADKKETSKKPSKKKKEDKSKEDTSAKEKEPKNSKKKTSKKGK